MTKRFWLLIWILALSVFIAGCIRLWGGAGYVKQTPGERTERVVGFDTAEALDREQSKGNITT